MNTGIGEGASSYVNHSLGDLVERLSGRKNPVFTGHAAQVLSSSVLGISRLRSRKNSVCIVETDEGRLVLKLFLTGRATKESRVLRRALLRRLRVPKIHAAVGNIILMEFIEGPNVCDLMNDTLEGRYAVELGKWFAQFHLAFKRNGLTLVRSDSILRNFLEASNGTYGVDFEEAHVGDGLEDVGQICASILDTDPVFTPKKYELCRTLITAYQEETDSDLTDVELHTANALRLAARFRPSRRRLLTKKASEIKRRRLLTG